MKSILAPSLIFVSILFSLSGCKSSLKQEKTVESEHLKDQSSANLLAINASQYGVKYPETFILMQNRKGLRIEYNLDRSNLQVWISPQAGKSMSYIDRNWSNRDDHTKVFDRILIPGVELSTFDSCDWDPFHSIIYFEGQELHIAQIYDEPAVLIWFGNDGLVDLKLYGEAVSRTNDQFILNHISRGRKFQSAAVLGPGEGYFQQQLELDKSRSTYTRAHMKPGQILVIASEIEEEQIGKKAAEWAKIPVSQILTENERKISMDLSAGQFQLKNKPGMQKLMDKSRRVALSMQDFKGFMRSTNQYIYYLMWYRDGGMNTSHIAYSGWTRPALDHARFALLNPNTSNKEPGGIFFGQVMGGPITKWQEDGLFYVIWPAFSHWTLTGDKTLCSGKNLETMELAMNWLENYCFDSEKGLFGRYFACETPMTGSRDDGWDNATGAPTFRWGSDYKGQTIVRSYDIYINLLNYSNYLMLSSMQEDDTKAELYLQKALNLEKNLIKFFDSDQALPSYGDLLTGNKEMIRADPYGMDIWDYVWALSLPPFTPTLPEKYQAAREQVRRDMTTTRAGYFHCVYFAMLTSMDTEVHNEDSIMLAMDKLVESSSVPGKYLPMPYAVPEMFNIPDGDPFHDVRPLVYSIAPWLSAITNLGIRKLPFGLAIRGTKYLSGINHYEYQGRLLNLKFSGDGDVHTIRVNGKELLNSLQIPDNMIDSDTCSIHIELGNNPLKSNQLISSSIRLISIEHSDDRIVFRVEAKGKNVLAFKNLNKTISITDPTGINIKYTLLKHDNTYLVEFPGRGEYKAFLE